MFSVITANRNDPSTLTVYLINGVTGRIVHQFKETNVSASPQHKVCQLFTEQYFILTVMRKNLVTGISQQELIVIELYSNKKEGNTKQLITEYLRGAERITSDRYSSFT
jgi:hypothetical protein